jgi:hypothetical protein
MKIDKEDIYAFLALGVIGLVIVALITITIIGILKGYL